MDGPTIFCPHLNAMNGYHVSPFILCFTQEYVFCKREGGGGVISILKTMRGVDVQSKAL